MKKENIKINGVAFEYINKNLGTPRKTQYCYDDIEDAYGRPSKTKINIWDYWVDWLLNINSKTPSDSNNAIWISSRNGYQFTIEGVVTIPETYEIVGIRITKAHNYCWSLAEL